LMPGCDSSIKQNSAVQRGGVISPSGGFLLPIDWPLGGATVSGIFFGCSELSQQAQGRMYRV
jgi:hypothetical protein